LSRYLSERFAALDAYVPGEQPADMEYIKLNTNESPYPPAPSVVAAINEAEKKKLNLYPNPDGSLLIRELAGFYGVGPENVVIGNGSDELLAFAFLAFCDSSHGVVFPDITYGFYPVYADLFGIPAKIIPLGDDFTLNPLDYHNAVRTVVIANPNAPTGVALSQADIDGIVINNPDNIVLIDEAYVDFGAESVIPLIQSRDNLLVVHTYSKSRSMAGARMAYMIGPAPVIEDIKKMKYSFNPYNVNRLTQTAAEAALREETYYNDRRREIVATREYTSKRLTELGFSLTDSKANFVFATHPEIGGYQLYTALRDRGILVRHWNKPRIADYVRITIGTTEQMDALIGAVASILSANEGISQGKGTLT